jgi:peptidyl-tRNA hydrolase, PTH1 family
VRLFVGLGNPGREYEGTRHNIGFRAIDAFAKIHGVELTQEKFYGTWAHAHLQGTRVGLLKPQTYMNLSGRAVAECVAFYKLTRADIIVVHDDVDFELGTLRLAWDRGAAGHRGVASIIAALGSSAFWRLRVGVGRSTTTAATTDFVLRPFAPAEGKAVEELLDRASAALDKCVTQDPARLQEGLHQT